MHSDRDPEIVRLRGALRDLIALFSISGVWLDREPPAVVEGLADALLELAEIDFAFVRFSDTAAAAVEATRGNVWTGFEEWLEDHLAANGRLLRREVIPEIGDAGDSLRGLVIPIGVDAESGLVVVASTRTDFPTDVDQLLLSMAANQAATAFQNACLIHERRRAEGELRGARDELRQKQAALRDIATLVASAASPEKIIAVVAEQVAQVMNVPLVRLVRYEPGGSWAEFIGGWAESVDSLTIGTRLPLDGPGVLASVWQTGRPARLDHYTDLEGQAPRALQQAGMRSAVASPISVEGRVWGAIAVLSPREEPLPEDTEARLADFTELVATTIANAEARDEVRSLLDEQETLRRVATLIARGANPEAVFVAVCDEAVGLFEAEQAAVVRLEVDEPALVTVGLSAGVQGATVGMRAELGEWPTSTAACRTGRTARTDVVAEEAGTGTIADMVRARGFLSTIAVPIIVDGRVWGAMTVSDSRRALAPDTERRIENFTDLIATAIANREAREALTASEARARALANEQAALRRVATLAARESSPVELLETVAEEAARVLGVDAIGMIRFEPDETATLVAQSKTPWDPLPLGTSFMLDGENVVASVHRTGQVARMDDWESATGGIAAMATVLGVRSAVACPIVVQGRPWGTMVAATNRSEPLPADTESRIVKFAKLLATAILNAESREALTRLAEEQAALRRVATLVAAGIEPDELFSAVSEEVARLVKADSAAVGRFEPDGSGIVAVGRSKGLSGIPIGTHADLDESPTFIDVYRTRRAARWSDRFYSSVAAPIVVGGSLWGVITVGTGREGLPSDTEERLEKFGELVATAIANAESRTELAASDARARELASEQAALRRVATLVAQGASPDEVFAAVADEVAGIIDIPVVGVARYEADSSFTILGVAGETSFTVGSRWPVEEEGIAGMILATGRTSRRDDYATVPGRIGETAREDLIVSTVGVPIVVGGSIWGFMIAAARPSRPIPTDTEARLARFTELVATAVSNASTRTDLLMSRARLVSTADETRRRLERDLHDGIQQGLVALALRARRVAVLSGTGESPASELSGLADDLVAVTDELREISHGIHPAILSDAGLDDALAALARRSAIRVDLDVSFQGRFDPTLEATVYYVVAESITNAVKHAQASVVAVRGALRGEAIEVEIEDGGIGGADPGRGTGLIGLRDRIDTLGGTISITSPAGAGTTIRVRLPASPSDGGHPPL